MLRTEEFARVLHAEEFARVLHTEEFVRVLHTEEFVAAACERGRRRTFLCDAALDLEDLKRKSRVRAWVMMQG